MNNNLLNPEHKPSVFRMALDTYSSIDSKQLRVLLLIAIVAFLALGCYTAYIGFGALFKL